MPQTALLFAHHELDATRLPAGLLPLAGWTVVERQARLAAQASADRIIICADRATQETALALARLRRDGIAAEVARNVAEAGNLVDAGDDVLMFAEGLVCDERVVNRLLQEMPGPVLMVRPDDGDERYERIDAASRWAGLALLPGALVREVSRRFGDWDMQSTLMRTAVQSDARRIAIDDVLRANPDRNGEVSPLFDMPQNRADAWACNNALLAQAGRAAFDWPGRFLHPPVENALVRALLPVSVSPLMLMLLAALGGLASIVCFAMGWLWAGLVIMLLLGPLDGVREKLARTRLQFSRWDGLAPVIGKSVEYGAFAALAGFLASQQGHYGPWALAAIIIGFALAGAMQGEFFNQYAGRPLADGGLWQRRFQLVAGGRNTFFWIMAPFAAFGAWQAALAAIAAYSLITFFVSQAFFFASLRSHALEHMPQIAARLRQSRRVFMPVRTGKPK